MSYFSRVSSGPGSTSGSTGSRRRSTRSSRPPAARAVRGDYVDLLPGLLAERPPDALTVVFQTASTGYLAEARYDELRRLARAGAERTGGRSPGSLRAAGRSARPRSVTHGSSSCESGRRRRASWHSSTFTATGSTGSIERDQLQGQSEAEARARAAAEEGARGDGPLRLRGRGSLRCGARRRNRPRRAADRR